MKPAPKQSGLEDIEAIASSWVLRVERGLTAAEQHAFARWKSADPRHADALARKERAWTAFDRPQASGQAIDLLERLAARRTRRRTRRLRSAVAVVGLFAGATLFWNLQPRAAPTPTENRAVVILPEQRTLPDGSTVELKPGAEFAFDFGGPLRRVTLSKGEAHFAVAKNKDRPFVVEANGVEVRAVGTAFAVQWGAATVQVVVTEGSVAVDKTRAPGPASPRESPVLVAAGSEMQVEVAPAAPRPVARSLDAAEMAARLDWRTTKVEFSELPLGEAVALMSRHGRSHFVVDDPGLARLPISGIFRADNSEAFVRLLEGTLGIRAERTGETIRLRPARE